MYPFEDCNAGSGLANRTLDILADARDRGAAVGAFTVYSLEGIRAVVEAAEATGKSAILQVNCDLAMAITSKTFVDSNVEAALDNPNSNPKQSPSSPNTGMV